MPNQAPEATTQCIFCKIISGEVNSLKVYEDSNCLAILDINPATKGHLLLMPKEHYALLIQAPDELVAHLGQVAKWLAYAAQKMMGATGVSIFAATGAVAGQNAPHAIIHIIPRYPNDGLGFELARQDVPLSELEKIRQALGPKLRAELGYDISAAKPSEDGGKVKEGSQKEADETPNLDEVTKMLGGEE